MMARSGKHKSSLNDIAYNEIKNDILACVLPPSTIVSTTQFCEMYNLGHAAVRHALGRLVGENFVVTLPQRGYRIASITIQDVLALYETIEAVFPTFARLSCGRIAEHNKAKLFELNRICAAAAPPSTREDEQRIIEAGREILRLLRESCGNRFVIELSRQLAEQIDRVLQMCRVSSDIPLDFRRDTSAVIGAMLADDPDEAELASRALCREMKNKVLSIVMSHPAVVSAELSVAAGSR